MFLPPGIVPPVVQFMYRHLWTIGPKEAMESMKFESGTNMDKIEENWKQFKEAIETCIEKHIPKKKISANTPLFLRVPIPIVSCFLDFIYFQNFLLLLSFSGSNMLLR
jgi:hypothetical protein